MKTKAIGYVRVSTDKQADRGVSLEAQVEKIKAMATVHDVELLDVLVDAGESAKDLPRVRGPWLQHRGRETGFPSIGPPTAGRSILREATLGQWAETRKRCRRREDRYWKPANFRMRRLAIPNPSGAPLHRTGNLIQVYSRKPRGPTWT